MNLLQIIFSVKNRDNHKVLTILGIKLKFKNKFKKLENDINSHEKNLNKNLNSKFKHLENKVNQLNIKTQKEFITDNINNENYFNFEQELYNFYEEMKALKMYPVFLNRVSIKNINSEIKKFESRFNKKIYILTDCDYIPSKYNVIDINDIEKYKNEDCIFVLAYNKDFNALEVARKLSEYNLKYFSLTQPLPLARYFHTNKIAYDVLVEEASANNNWHFCPVDFENIFQVLENCKNLDGDYVEIGTFKGDSASATLNYMQKAGINKKSYFFDTFHGFDYDEAYKSEDGLWQNTHKGTSLEAVQKRLSKYKNIEIIQSNIITDELPTDIEKICAANIDVDMYEAVKAALYKLKDKIVKNGIIICEDYGHTPGLIGAQKATEEFLAENPDMFIKIYLNSGQLFLIKK